MLFTYSILLALLVQVFSFMDCYKVKYAIDAGSPYYYKDKNKILFRYDQGHTGGTTNTIPIKVKEQQHYLIPLQYLDFKVFSTERILKPEEDSFTYQVHMRLNGNYTLLLCFVENEYKQIDRRLFDIYIEGMLVRNGVDLFKEAGGNGIPMLYPIEIEFKEKTLIVGNYNIEMPETKLHFDVQFKGVGAKLNGLMLYQGHVYQIIQDLEVALEAKDRIESTYLSQNEFVRVVKQKAIRYGMRMRGKQDGNSTMSQYLCPFQYILNTVEVLDKDLQVEFTTWELANDIIISLILVPLGNCIAVCCEFIVENKLFIMGLVVNTVGMLYCFVATGSKSDINTHLQYQCKLNYGINSYDKELVLQSPKSRSNKHKSKKKKQ